MRRPTKPCLVRQSVRHLWLSIWKRKGHTVIKIGVAVPRDRSKKCTIIFMLSLTYNWFAVGFPFLEFLRLLQNLSPINIIINIVIRNIIAITVVAAIGWFLAPSPTNQRLPQVPACPFETQNTYTQNIQQLTRGTDACVCNEWTKSFNQPIN